MIHVQDTVLHEHLQVMVRLKAMGIPCSQYPGCSWGCLELHHIKQPLRVSAESITFKNIEKKIKSWLSRRDTISPRNTKPVLGLSPSLPGLCVTV